MQDLANPTKPLNKLARNAPHGFKNEKLLETLAAKQVPFLRATWYIKIVGLSEMVSHLLLCVYDITLLSSIFIAKST